MHFILGVYIYDMCTKLYVCYAPFKNDTKFSLEKYKACKERDTNKNR